MSVKIIGLAGTHASGKDTVGKLLAEKYGYLHISTSDMLRAEKKRVFGDGPESLLTRNDSFVNNLRKEQGPGILIELAVEEYKRVADKYPGGLVASGIRAIGEADVIKKMGGEIVFVDADPRTRYQRVIGRKRDANDNNVTFKEFMDMERSESDVDPHDLNIQNIPAMKDRADILLMNNGSDIEAFKEQIQKALGLSYESV